MKLSKAKLIKLVKPGLEKLGFKEFKNSSRDWQGLFCKKLSNDLYLTVGLTIHRYYESAFTGDYYFSNATTIGAQWGGIPTGIYQRPSFLLNESERQLFQTGNINSNHSKDIWFDGSDEKSVGDFLHVIAITVPRFINQPDLITDIKNSKELRILSEYADKVKELVNKNQLQGSYKFIPSKEVDDIPINWFKASERVLSDAKSVVNSHTVIRLAADAYRQTQLSNA